MLIKIIQFIHYKCSICLVFLNLEINIKLFHKSKLNHNIFVEVPLNCQLPKKEKHDCKTRTEWFILQRWLSYPASHWEKVLLPEHPLAGVSSGSWTSWGCPSLQGWRPPPHQPDCRVGSPWTERSGRSGCWETGQLQNSKKHIKKRLSLCLLSSFCPFLDQTLVIWDVSSIRNNCSPPQNNPSFGQEEHY